MSTLFWEPASQRMRDADLGSSIRQSAKLALGQPSRSELLCSRSSGVEEIKGNCTSGSRDAAGIENRQTE